MRNLLATWRAPAKALCLADYRRSMVFDAIAGIAIVTYLVASRSGPPPTWAKMIYLVGIVACGVAANARRSWFSLACIAVLTAITVEQVVSGEWLVR